MIDAYYTPPFVSDALARYLPEALAGNVLDPAAGHGALLEAVSRRYPTGVVPLAIDVESAAIDVLKLHEGWEVSQADVLHSRSIRQARAWKHAREDLSAVVLNPPFSYRGNGGPLIQYGDFVGQVSPAVAFLATVLKDLNPKHGFWAILPLGALRAVKHQKFWDEVHSTFEVTRLEEFDSRVFTGARVSTVLVHIKRSVGRTDLRSVDDHEARPILKTSCICVEIIRGRFPVHRDVDDESGSLVPFLHTTNLGPRQGRTRAVPSIYADDGPFLIIARVGMWRNPKRISLKRVVLSDCLIAMRPLSVLNLVKLDDSVRSVEEQFRGLYSGTGSKYITLGQVVDLLRHLGWAPYIAKGGATVGPCRCDFGQIA